MRNNRSKYPIMDTIKEGQTVPTTADNVAKAGTWAEQTAILALANASNIDFRIWAFENSLQKWRFYQIPPNKPQKDMRIVWLQLRDNHYQWLKPKPKAAPLEAITEWLSQAVDEPIRPGGARRRNNIDGGSQHSNTSALRALGLASSSSQASAGSNASALAALGLQPPRSQRSTSSTNRRPLSALGLRPQHSTTNNTSGSNVAVL